MRPLPAPCRWIDYPEKSCLMWHFGCVAVVHTDGRVTIQWAHGKTIESRAASLKQGKRHAEQWIAARPGLPPGKRAIAMRERMRHPIDVGAIAAQILHRPETTKAQNGPKSLYRRRDSNPHAFKGGGF